MKQLAADCLPYYRKSLEITYKTVGAAICRPTHNNTIAIFY